MTPILILKPKEGSDVIEVDKEELIKLGENSNGLNSGVLCLSSDLDKKALALGDDFIWNVVLFKGHPYLIARRKK